MVAILTKEGLGHILDTYATAGVLAAQALAQQYGVKKTYIRKLASTHGVKAKRKKRIHKFKPCDDPRWAWAIERGPVIA